MNRPASLAALGTFAFSGIASAAYAQTYIFFPNNATINYTVFGETVIGYANNTDYKNKKNGSSPTINIKNGSGFDSVLTYNHSITNVSGGTIPGGLIAQDFSQGAITGGSFSLLATDNSSKFTINGGSFFNGIYAYNTSSITFRGGSSNNLTAFNISAINVQGGSVNYVQIFDNSLMNITGGVINSFLAYQNSTLNLYGAGMSATLINAQSNVGGIITSQYVLSGTLSDGSDLTGKQLFIQNNTSPRVFLHNAAVPEPGSLALLFGMGTVGVCVLRKRRRG